MEWGGGRGLPLSKPGLKLTSSGNEPLAAILGRIGGVRVSALK